LRGGRDILKSTLTNIKGKIHYFESQVGGEYNPNRVLSGVRHGSVKIMKIDNLRISDRAKKSV
jgi:hypothetical protein